MKQIAKLKDEARKYEQREEWDRAIQAYGEVLRLGEAGDGAELDLPLYNRVGDLYVRLGRAAEAVKYYEQAADKYAEAGLYNNAIALCNKALRYDAGRVELLKKLGQFSASQGFFTDARRWYLEYCERMSKRGAIDQAFTALSELADVHDDPEIRELLARQLKDHNHPERAIDEYRRAYALRMSRGETAEAEAIRAEIHDLDPDASLEVTTRQSTAGVQTNAYEELPGFLDEPASSQVAFDGPVQASTLDTETIEIETAPTSFDVDAESETADYGTIEIEQPETASADMLDDLLPFDIGIEPSLEFKPPVEEPAEPIETEEPAEAMDMEQEPLFQLSDLGLDTPVETFEEISGDEPLSEELPVFEDDEAVVEEDALPLPGWDEEGELAGDSEPLPFIEADADPMAAPGRDEWPRFEIEDVAGSVSEPILPETEVPFTPPAIFEIEAPAEAEPAFRDEEASEPEAETAFDAEADFEPASVFEEEPVLDEEPVLETAPAVEPVVEPEPVPEPEPAFQAEQPVELEPHFEPPPAFHIEPEAPKPAPEPAPLAAAAPAAPEYVDLGAFLLDDPEPEDTTRFVVAEKAPTGDEDRDFADMLQQFKAKVAEVIPKEDAGSHYDLGLAFKEMGLIDEAIAEFQTALRGGEEKLKVYEELGNCFVQKRQYSVAITILNRAMQMPYNDEAELLGVYYNLGRAHEEIGQHSEARSAYERIISVDIGFQDTSERLAKL